MNSIIVLVAVLFALLSSSASAQVEICQLLSDGTAVLAGQTEPTPRGKVIAQANKARLGAGETCDTWRAKKQQELVGGNAGCILLADGKQIFEGFGNEPPRRGTEIARGKPDQGQSCDNWRQKKANSLITGGTN